MGYSSSLLFAVSSRAGTSVPAQINPALIKVDLINANFHDLNLTSI